MQVPEMAVRTNFVSTVLPICSFLSALRVVYSTPNKRLAVDHVTTAVSLHARLRCEHMVQFSYAAALVV
jgi:hypothetical protein